MLPGIEIAVGRAAVGRLQRLPRDPKRLPLAPVLGVAAQKLPGPLLGAEPSGKGVDCRIAPVSHAPPLRPSGIGSKILSMSTPSLMQMIQALIATPSVSSVNPRWDLGNRELVELLAGWLEPLGFAVSILPVCGRDDKFNLVANRGSGPEGLVLSGHTDTVPYDERRWQHDPFRATEENDRVYGLGSADMKSFFAFIVATLQDCPWSACAARSPSSPPPTRRAACAAPVPCSRAGCTWAGTR